MLPAGVATLFAHQIAEYHERGVLGAWRHKDRRANGNAALQNLLVAVEAHTVQWL